MHRGTLSHWSRKVFPWMLSSYLHRTNSHCHPISNWSISIYSTIIPKPLTYLRWSHYKKTKPKCPSAAKNSKMHLLDMNTMGSDATIANLIRIQSSVLLALMQVTMNPIDLKKLIVMAVIVIVEIKLLSNQKDFVRSIQVNPKTFKYHLPPKSISIIFLNNCLSGSSC